MRKHSGSKTSRSCFAMQSILADDRLFHRARGVATCGMPETHRLTFDGRIRSVKFALRGIRVMVASQHNAWIHAAATVVVVAAGLMARLPASSWAWIVLAIGSVWTAEALNTAFEFLTDV